MILLYKLKLMSPSITRTVHNEDKFVYKIQPYDKSGWIDLQIANVLILATVHSNKLASNLEIYFMIFWSSLFN